MIPLVLNTPGRLSSSGVPTGVFLESCLPDQEWLECECAGLVAEYGVPGLCVLGREKSVFGVLISELYAMCSNRQVVVLCLADS